MVATQSTRVAKCRLSALLIANSPARPRPQCPPAPPGIPRGMLRPGALSLASWKPLVVPAHSAPARSGVTPIYGFLLELQRRLVADPL